MAETGCEFPAYNPPSEQIRQILETSKVVAMVGLSPRPDRDSNQVARYLMDHGFTVVPVNPREEQILGQQCYPDLESIPIDVDIVDVFRRVEFIPSIVEAAIRKKARVIWMQLGLAHNESADKAREAGLEVVMSKCLKVEHARLALS
jgi:predicted CoA-binding protein